MPGNHEIRQGWLAFDLPGCRPHPQPSTYSLFPYEALPPLRAPLDDDFRWLENEPVKLHSMADGAYADGSKPDLGKLAKIADRLEIPLPGSFVAFMTSANLHQRLRSCTDCYFDVADRAVKTTTGFLIHFLSDSQWCAHWYLHLGQSGDHCVAASFHAFGFGPDINNPQVEGEIRQDKLDLAREEVWFCSPTFLDFIYRFWLENEIWFALAWDKRPLDERQQAYVDWYRNHQPAP